MITSKTPSTWKDLQNSVAQIFTECGFFSEVEKEIKSSRGNVEIDVYVEYLNGNINNTILVECKHWKKRVPKTIVHSFGQVVSNTGANTGYIVSLNGFQKGSFEAAKHTNLKLLTWKEFQDLYREQWLNNYFSNYIDDHFTDFMEFTEPLPRSWFSKLDDKDQKKIYNLTEQYRELGTILLFLENPESRYLSKSKTKTPSLPLRQSIKSSKIDSEILDVEGYRELIPILHKHIDPISREFKTLKEKVS